jgi:integrase
MVIAERWERQAKQLGPAVHLQNRDAVLEAFVDATQKAVAGEMTEVTARGVLDRILESMGQSPIYTESVRDFSQRWVSAGRSGLASASHVAYQYAVRLFLDHLGRAADKPLRAVLTRHIESFKAARIGAGLSAKTVDRDLKVVRSIFRAGVKQGHLTFDPTQAVSLTSRQSKRTTQRVTREILHAAELDAILREAKGEWVTATLIGRYTGARMGDCVRLLWSNVDLAAGLIRYSDQKTGKAYAVPTHKRLQEHLLSIAGNDDPDGLLCPTLGRKQTGGCNGLSAQFQKLMRKAGVDTMQVETKVLQKVKGKTARTLARRSFHSIRHTYNTELANADVSQEIRRKLVGHSSDDVNDIYTHLDLTLFRGAINKLA